MTNLSDFLKVKKVRYINDDEVNLTEGKEYEVTTLRIEVKANDGEKWLYPWWFFEPVIETAIEATDTLDDTPMGTRTVNEFEVGDRVYCPFVGKQIFDVKNHSSSLAYPLLVGGLHINTEGYFHQDGIIVLYHATPENYEMLCKLYPHIEFEKPKQELTGSDLCRALLDKGEKFIMVKDDTDTWRIICDYCDDWFTDVTGKCLKNVTPVDSKGKPLTSEVVND